MERASSGSSQSYPQRASRPRSLSLQTTDAYFNGMNIADSSGQLQPEADVDVDHVDTMHRELLSDNLRLWECVNILRCNPRLPATQVLRQLSAMTDEEFYRKYPSYAEFCESGHGALHSQEEGGGLRCPDRYVQHVKVHNSGLLRENARLLLCLDLLNHTPARCVDEVVCHCFGLSDDDFIRHYPASGQLLKMPLRRLADSQASGPSCSNNNDIFNIRRARRHLNFEQASQDLFYTDRRYSAPQAGALNGSNPQGGSMYIQGCSTSNGLSRSASTNRRLSSPRSSSPRTKWNSATPMNGGHHRDGSPGKGPVPYMVTLHPYNWATSNNSASQSRSVDRKQPEVDGPDFQPEDNEDGGVIYRKQRRSAPPSVPQPYAGPLKRGQGSVSPMKSELPQISFSKSPATSPGYQSDNARQSTEPYTSKFSLRHERVLDSKRFCQRPRSLSHVAVPGPSGNNMSLSSTVTNKAKGRPAGKQSPPWNVSSRKGFHCQSKSSTPLRPAGNVPSTKTRDKEKDLTFQQDDLDMIPLYSKEQTGTRISGLPPSPTQCSAHALEENHRPMYYKPAEKKTQSCYMGKGANDGSSPRRRLSVGATGKSRLPVPSVISPESPSPRSTRSSRSFSRELFSPLHDTPDLLQSRHELLELRDAFHGTQSSQNPMCEQEAFWSPDSLDTSPVQNVSSSPRTCLNTSPELERNKDSVRLTSGLLGATDTNMSYSSSPVRFAQTHKTGIPDSGREVNKEFTMHWATGVPLDTKKQHRTPTHRHISSSSRVKDKTKGSLVEDNSQSSGVSRSTRHGDVANRDQTAGSPFSSLSLSLSPCKKGTRRSLPQGLLSTTKEKTTVDYLIEEKRQIERRYRNVTRVEKSLTEPLSARTTGHREEKSRQVVPVKHPPVRDDFATRVPRSPRESSTETGRQHGWSTLSAKEEELRQCSLERLRAETAMLRDEMEKCRLWRQKRLDRDESMREAFIGAYDNLGKPLPQDCTSATKENPSTLKNKNSNSVYSNPAPDQKYILHPDDDETHYERQTTPDVDTVTEKSEESLAGNEFYDAPKAILGEVAFQLERRIMHQVFRGDSVSSDEDMADAKEDQSGRTYDYHKRHCFYGFTVQNLPQKIRWASRDPATGKKDGVREARLLRRLKEVIGFLRDSCGYRVRRHGQLCQDLITQHGLFLQSPDGATIARLGLHDFRSVRNHVIRLSSPMQRPDMLVLVDCLAALAHREQKPVLCFQ